MTEPFNPFLTTGYHGVKYFCDRKKETAALLSNIKNGNNTTLFALRRLGKTGLIQHCFSQLSNSRKTACIYVDIFATQNLKGFTNQLATAIYNRFPQNKGIGAKLMAFIKLLKPVISFDPLTGNPEISLELGQAKQFENTIQQLFAFLDSQGIKVVIAIDEFQQILTYPEKNVEAVLRTYMQSLKNVHFIFCGSNQRMMNEIFNNAKRPFYASCNNMQLGFISRHEYALFITTHFKEKRRKISAESIEFILDFTQCHTYYTQVVCNQLFASQQKDIQVQNVMAICKQVLTQNEPVFYQYRNLLTQAQWELLTAIAKETTVAKPHSNEFIKKYGLGTSSLITRGIESLLAKEMIYYTSSKEGSYYAVYDKFLMRWMETA
jgi:uncharacterized protein